MAQIRLFWLSAGVAQSGFPGGPAGSVRPAAVAWVAGCSLQPAPGARDGYRADWAWPSVVVVTAVTVAAELVTGTSAR